MCKTNDIIHEHIHFTYIMVSCWRGRRTGINGNETLPVFIPEVGLECDRPAETQISRIATLGV